MISIPDLQRKIRGEIRVNEPLAAFTSFGVGGPADYVVNPSGRIDLTTALTIFRGQDIPTVLMRSGSAILISDRGFRGACLLTDTALGDLVRENGGTIYAGASVRLAALADFCVSSGLGGAEGWAGNEMTVEYALTRGAGHGSESLEKFVEAVDILHVETVSSLPREEAVREIRKKNGDLRLVLGARFRFPRGVKERLMRSRREFLIQRNRLHPLNIAGGGVIFRDPPGELAVDLLEKAGMKGKKRGGAMVSREHANVFINTGGATADDFVRLIRNAQDSVRRRCGINLELEITTLGFAATSLPEVA
jgi:UDP-N-acetylmuramate dehydrogenase